MRRTPLLWLAAVLVSGEALATANYPGIVKTETGSSVTPPCTLCHMDNNGGSGTVVQDFGVMLMSRGLTGSNPTKLKSVLADIHQANVDTDGDGTTDFDELTKGRNPNVSGAGGVNDCFPGSTACGGGGTPLPDGGTNPGGGGTGGNVTPLPDPTYGCSAGAGGGALAGVLLAGTALFSAVRRRRS